MNKKINLNDLFDAIEEEQDVNKVRELIEAGYYVDFTVEEGCTPLIAAVLIGNLEIVKLLVELGADVNIKDMHGETALFYAKFNAFQEIADYLEPLTAPKIKLEVEREMKYLETGSYSSVRDYDEMLGYISLRRNR